MKFNSIEEAIADIKLGKEVIICKDTPGFIGNRIGIFWVQCAIHEAIKAGLTVEEADAVMGRPIGVPKTGVFGLMDVVGIDLIPHISVSMLANLSKEDEYCKIHNEAKTMKSMLEKIKSISEGQLRIGGLIFTVIGFIIIWYFKR